MVDRAGTRAALALGLIASLGAACSAGASTGSTAVTWVPLDGSPRHPSDAGVLTALDDEFASLVLDGETRYRVSRTVQSFAGPDGSTQPLRSRIGQYVQIGVEAGEVVWVAGIGAVVRVPGQPEQVLYMGRVVEIDGDEITLLDGTVLQLAAGKSIEGKPTRDAPVTVLLHLDVVTDTVVEVQSA